MAETNGLLNRRTLKRVPRVRIPPSPPMILNENLSPEAVGTVHKTGQLPFLKYLIAKKYFKIELSPII